MSSLFLLRADFVWSHPVSMGTASTEMTAPDDAESDTPELLESSFCIILDTGEVYKTGAAGVEEDTMEIADVEAGVVIGGCTVEELCPVVLVGLGVVNTNEEETDSRAGDECEAVDGVPLPTDFEKGTEGGTVPRPLLSPLGEELRPPLPDVDMDFFMFLSLDRNWVYA